MKLNYKLILIASIFSLFVIDAQAIDSRIRVWKTCQGSITQLSDKTIKIQNDDVQGVIIDFELSIDNVYPNIDLPIALVTTYDKSEVEESKDENGTVIAKTFWACSSFIVDLKEGKKYPYEKSCSSAVSNIWSPDGKYALNGLIAKIILSRNLLKFLKGEDFPLIEISGFNHGCGGVTDADSWRWVSNDIVTFSGGACGTFFNYLFYIPNQRTEVFCSEFQKTGYGCPGDFSRSASDFKKRLLELQGKFNYSALKSYISAKQIEFQRKYSQAKTARGKEKVFNESQIFLFDILTDNIFLAWLGTPWSFNGITRVPGSGSIACGTFVVYTLQDVGFKIPSRMARQPSENIIKNLIGTEKIKRFANASSMKIVESWIEKNGEGLYIVGLDAHIGFIKYKKGKITFLHSSYYNPPLKVVDQNISEKSPLTDSQYRVVGKIIDKNMVKIWLENQSFPVKYDYFDR